MGVMGQWPGFLSIQHMVDFEVAFRKAVALSCEEIIVYVCPSIAMLMSGDGHKASL